MLEQVFQAATCVVDHGEQHGLGGSRLAVAGDAVGGNVTVALTLLSQRRGGPSFAAQVLFYPLTDAASDTDSYRQFSQGLLLHPARHAVVLGPVHDRSPPA